MFGLTEIRPMRRLGAKRRRVRNRPMNILFKRHRAHRFKTARHRGCNAVQPRDVARLPSRAVLSHRSRLSKSGAHRCFKMRGCSRVGRCEESASVMPAIRGLRNDRFRKMVLRRSAGWFAWASACGPTGLQQQPKNGMPGPSTGFFRWMATTERVVPDEAYFFDKNILGVHRRMLGRRRRAAAYV